jgi:hypothetical protein
MRNFWKTTILSAIFASAAAGEAPPKLVDEFLAKHCFECHEDTTAKGNLNLLDLTFELTDPGNFADWKQVFERVEWGEMPPEKKPRPDAEMQKAALHDLEGPLLAADLADRKTNGRVKARRLTRLEYEFTLHDLLGIDLPLQEFLPEDPLTHGFETVAEGQQLSHFNLAAYLETADIALAEAFARAFKGDEVFEKEFTAADLTKKPPGNNRGPQRVENEAVFWPMRLQFYGRLPTKVPESGWYQITLKNLRAMNPSGPSVWGTLRSGANASNAPILYPVGLVEATKEKRNLIFEAWIREGHSLELKPHDLTRKSAPNGAGGGTVSYKNRDITKEGFEGFAVSAIQMKRIYPNAQRWEGRNFLLPGLTKEERAEIIKAEVAPEQLLRKTIHAFANRAFRRPVTEEQTAPYVELGLAELSGQDKRAPAVLLAAYRAILCSPRFLTFTEPLGKLDAHALANRLSYMLWNSMPDSELRKLADGGEFLEDPKLRHAQVNRMLGDPKAERFIVSFTDQWLNLKEIDFTTPDRRLYWQFDPTVQESMLAETRAFVRELILKNKSVTNVIDSDFGMLNERLVRFYDMKGLDVKPGEGLQRVAVKEIQRSGLITQGAILKVTANGTTTSPVVRGVFVGERILGLEIPPPPDDVPAVEPDIRGAVSIRDQLDKHRNEASCAACHLKIDPAGFALENYNPIGLWRTTYGKKKTSAKVSPSGVTLEGEKFQGIGSWKKIYVGRPEQLTFGFARQLLTYATGAPPRFSDRAALEKIIDHARENDFGMKSIVHAVVASEAFRTK